MALNTLEILTLLNLTPKPVKSQLLALIIGSLGSVDTLQKLKNVTAQYVKKSYSLHDFEQAQRKAQLIMTACQQQGISCISYHQANFPKRLRSIPNSPVLLYAKGNTALLNEEDAIAVVGSRTVSTHGVTAGKRISRILVEQGYTVVSGLALGCDQAAHEGCVDAGGKTVAVLAHGLDKIYPRQNQILAQQILKQDGCLVSEYPPGHPAERSQFVERNRLQSGLSRAVIIIESATDGGTMHTARFAKEQHRRIACLNYSSDILRTQPNINISGNKKLVSEGAASFVDDAQLLEFLDGLKKKPVHRLAVAQLTQQANLFNEL